MNVDERIGREIAELFVGLHAKVVGPIGPQHGLIVVARIQRQRVILALCQLRIVHRRQDVDRFGDQTIFRLSNELQLKVVRIVEQQR